MNRINLFLGLILLTLPLVSFQKNEPNSNEHFEGEWIAWRDSSKTQFSYLFLSKDQTSYHSLGFEINGKKRFIPNMTDQIDHWSISGDSIILNAKPEIIDGIEARQHLTFYYIITERFENSFKAYYYDPILAEEYKDEVDPIGIILHFHKTLK